MSAPGSTYESKKPSKDDYELDDLPEVTQGTVTPVGVPPRGDPEYEAKLAQLGLGESGCISSLVTSPDRD